MQTAFCNCEFNFTEFPISPCFLIQIQAGESQPFIEEILQHLNSIICDLSQPQVHVFYEAIGHIIYSATSRSMQEQFIEKLMILPNSIWVEAIDHASKVISRIFEFIKIYI